MIESISISNVASYSTTPEVLDKLSKFNFIFGSNGVGKTTISRVIAGAQGHTHCKVNWANGTKLQNLVYNRDFVDSNFDQSSTIKGVFTLGDKDIELQREIEKKKRELDAFDQKISTLKNTLGSVELGNGKLAELKQLEDDIKRKCWNQKQKHDDSLQGAFEGYRGSADKFAGKVFEEMSSNKSLLISLNDLTKKAETVFGKVPDKENLIPPVNIKLLITHESNPILAKRVLGKEDVDIASMISKLGNSDWVREGRQFYAQNEDVCPFCQQHTEKSFATSLEEYFDETFDAETKLIDALESDYKRDAETILRGLTRISNAPYKFLDKEKFETAIRLLDALIEHNFLVLAEKRKAPSMVVNLNSVTEATTQAQILIDDANTQATEHNTIVDNIKKERETLTSQVWKFVLEELKTDLDNYHKNKKGVESAISSLQNQISEKTTEKAIKTQDIKALEKKSTSIQPTVDGINNLLQTFGFHSFSIAPADEERNYKLVRPDGSDAKATLSEGERTFITFLYFYHLLKGSNSEEGITNDRVVVFDDPISSLDSDVLFIVSSLIRGLLDEVRDGTGYIKQVFILTHNVYFHKEVTFNPKRPPDGVITEESFWVVRKSNNFSKVEKQTSNPVRTSYELLWTEVKRADKSNLSIQNTLRRILENYFKIFGGIDTKQLADKFTGKDKLICQSLMSWVNDGSHSILDDVYVSNTDITVNVYLDIFKQIFEKNGHFPHYQMMMGLPLETQDE